MKVTLLRASVGWLLRHPWQLALALIGICIGVAVMVAVDLANESARKAYTLSANALNGEATHQVVGGPGGIDEAVYVSLRTEAGLRNVAPVVTGVVRFGGESLQLIGVDLFAEREFRAFAAPEDIAGDITGVSGGPAPDMQDMVRRFLTVPGSLLLPRSVVDRYELGRDDTFEIVVDGRSETAILAGAFTDEGRGLSNVAVADIALAQDWLGLSGRLSRIDVRIDDADPESIRSVADALPPGVQLLPAESRTQATLDMSNAFMTNLTAMSLLAMLVGIFLIYNSVAFAVLQRRGLVGTLRALGVTRGQVARIMLGEALLLGLLGSVTGIGAGVWLGDRLVSLVARTVTDHYFVVSVTNVSIEPLSLVKGLVAGLGSTLLAAAIPAAEASRTPPRLAMTRSIVEKSARSVIPRLALAGTGMIIIASLMLLSSGRDLVAGLTALFVLILGFSLCVPAFVQSLAAVMAPVAGRIAGTPGRMAIDGIRQTLSRTGVAIVALAVAVSATIGVTLMVESFRSSVSDWIGTTLQSDIYAGVPRGSIDPALLADLVQVPGIEHYSTSRRAWVETAAGRVRIVALQMAPGSYAGTRLRSADSEQAWGQFDDGTGVLVSDAYAYRYAVEPGSTVELPTANGPVRLAVVGVYQNYDSNDGAVLMSRRTYDRLFNDRGVDSVGLYLQPGVDADETMDRLRSIADGRQALMMTGNERIRDLSLAIFDRTFVITNVLYWLAVGVAVIGILGAMMALQLERAREFGILRAIGMTPRQTGALVTTQSGLMGFMAGIAAMPLGLVMAWILVAVINRRAFGWHIDLVIEPGALITALLLSVGAALVAGIYPAFMAGRIRPALAMRQE